MYYHKQWCVSYSDFLGWNKIRMITTSLRFCVQSIVEDTCFVARTTKAEEQEIRNLWSNYLKYHCGNVIAKVSLER